MESLLGFMEFHPCASLVSDDDDDISDMTTMFEQSLFQLNMFNLSVGRLNSEVKMVPFVFYLSANCIMPQFMRRFVFGLKHCHYCLALTNSTIRALKNLCTPLSFSAKDNGIVKSG